MRKISLILIALLTCVIAFLIINNENIEKINALIMTDDNVPNKISIFEYQFENGKSVKIEFQYNESMNLESKKFIDVKVNTSAIVDNEYMKFAFKNTGEYLDYRDIRNYDEYFPNLIRDDNVFYDSNLNKYYFEFVYIGYFDGAGFEYKKEISEKMYFDYIDTTSPNFNGEGIYLVDIDNSVSVEKIKDSLTAIDNIDGDLTNKIIIESDNYSSNKNKLGDYEIDFSVTDSSGNTAKFTVLVRVVDITKPNIFFDSSNANISKYYKSNNIFEVGYKETMSVDEIKSHYKAQDNYDGDITSDIEILNDEYTSNKSTLGNYEILLNVKDTSDNESKLSITVNVIDNIAPVFNDINIVEAPLSNGIKTIAYIKSLLSATDEIDGNIDVTIKSDRYTNNAKKVGEYEVVFIATDSSGNIAEHIVIVKVIDDIIPTIFVDDYIIPKSEAEKLTLEQITNMLQKSIERSLSLGVKRMTLVNDNYSGNENKIGTYSLSYSVQLETDEIIEKEISVKVLDSDILNENTDDLNFFENAVLTFKQFFFKHVWKFIVGFVLFGIISVLVIYKKIRY